MPDRPDTSENAPSRANDSQHGSGPRARRAGFSARVARQKREQTPDGRVHAPPRRVGHRRGTDPTTLGRRADACIRDAASARAARHARLRRPGGVRVASRFTPASPRDDRADRRHGHTPAPRPEQASQRAPRGPTPFAEALASADPAINGSGSADLSGSAARAAAAGGGGRRLGRLANDRNAPHIPTRWGTGAGRRRVAAAPEFPGRASRLRDAPLARYGCPRTCDQRVARAAGDLAGCAGLLAKAAVAAAQARLAERGEWAVREGGIVRRAGLGGPRRCGGDRRPST
jgi:hypothetical protein